MIRRFVLLAAAISWLAVNAPAKSARSVETKKTKPAVTSRLDAATSASRRAAKGGAEDKTTTLTEEVRKSDAPNGTKSGNVAVTIDLSGEIKERSETLVLFSSRSKSLKDYLDLMRKLREDASVKTVVFRLTGAQIGVAMAEEFRSAIGELRAAGKKTYAVLEDDSQPSYLIACACDQIILPPSAELMLYGVKAEAYFFRSLLEKLGVHAQIVHIGKYKSYGEMFTEDEFTSPARENMTQIVDDVYSQMVDSIASSRKLGKPQVEQIINNGPMAAEDALKAKLIDRVAYGDALIGELKAAGAKIVESSDYGKESRSKSSEDSGFLALLNAVNKSSDSEEKSNYPQVAVVYAVGPIAIGSKDGVGLGNDEQILSGDFIDTLDEVEKESKIKAVILRIDSPGGSAFASDLIWKKVVELKKTKPVIVSMGDVAASGGYYIAMGANKIIADRGTMTGSIGVVGGKMNLGGGYEKLGVHKVTISKGNYATLYSETSNFSPQERQLVEKMMKKTYDEFVAKAAEGRKVTPEKLNEVAQGKVWLGERAKTVGLVDEIGGLSRAIVEAKLLMGLKKDAKVSLVSYPKEVNVLSLLQKALGGSMTSQAQMQPHMAAVQALAPELSGMLMQAQALVRMFEREKVLTVMPFIPKVN